MLWVGRRWLRDTLRCRADKRTAATTHCSLHCNRAASLSLPTLVYTWRTRWSQELQLSRWPGDTLYRICTGWILRTRWIFRGCCVLPNGRSTKFPKSAPYLGPSCIGVKGPIVLWFGNKVGVSFARLLWKFELVNFRDSGIIRGVVKTQNGEKIEVKHFPLGREVKTSSKPSHAGWSLHPPVHHALLTSVHENCCI